MDSLIGGRRGSTRARSSRSTSLFQSSDALLHIQMPLKLLTMFRPRLPRPATSLLFPGLRTISPASPVFAAAPRVLRTAPHPTTRSLSTSSPRAVRHGGSTYRRFGQGPQRGPVIPVKTLVAVTGGSVFLYVYNLETVEVSTNPLCLLVVALTRLNRAPVVVVSTSSPTPRSSKWGDDNTTRSWRRVAGESSRTTTPSRAA